MKALDVMVSPVITISPDTSIEEAADTLLKNRISGMPVLDGTGALVGIISEGDFLRRVEAGTERHRPRWLELLTRGDTIAAEYVKSHGRKVSDVMTTWPVSVGEDTPLMDIADLMESRQIKRVPVVRAGKVVGIVSRANLLQGLLAREPHVVETVASDDNLRDRVNEELDRHTWASDVSNVVVENGAVHLWGQTFSPTARDAVRVAIENVPGVKRVMNNIVVLPVEAALPS